MTGVMPALFLGHGSPMNALADNAFTRRLASLGRRIGRPRAVLCVSAHWLTEGSWATHMSSPRTIHDFYGFPDELFQVRYPAPGSPETAELARAQAPRVQLDDEMWGLDHGAWSVLRHMYPDASVPVIQLSLDFGKPAPYHLALGRALRPLRERGVLIVGSGNIVHNLPRLRWEENAEPYPWAVAFDARVKAALLAGDVDAVLEAPGADEAARLSVPTPDHWYPLLYVLGAARDAELPVFEHEGIENGSISMRCASFGLPA